MRPIHAIASALAALALAVGAVTAWQGAHEEGGPPPAPVDPGGVRDVLYARPFVLEQGYANTWREEQPLVTAGWLLVLEVDTDRVVPRQMLEPVLYVQGDTAESINQGWPSGRVVVLAPAPEGADGKPAALESLRAWFGPPELPERIDQADLALEGARADELGLAAFAPERFAAARARGGALLELPDRIPLERLAAELVLEFAPGEEQLARSLLVPLSR